MAHHHRLLLLLLLVGAAQQGLHQGIWCHTLITQQQQQGLRTTCLVGPTLEPWGVSSQGLVSGPLCTCTLGVEGQA